MNTQIKSPSAIAAHTPGPWHLSGMPSSKRPQWEYVYGGDRGLVSIATVAQSTDVCTTPETQEEAGANARLIAAAPELLAALVRARDHLITSGVKQTDAPEALAQARAAIARARQP